jgi:hypothetical protein
MGFGLSGMTDGLLRLFLSTIDRTTTRKNLLFGPAGYDCTFGVVKRAVCTPLRVSDNIATNLSDATVHASFGGSPSCQR